MRCAGGGPVKYGGIRELTEFQTNLKMNCIPDTDLDVEHYQEFRQAPAVNSWRKKFTSIIWLYDLTLTLSMAFEDESSFLSSWTIFFWKITQLESLLPPLR